MSLTTKDVARLADLARLDLSKEELTTFATQLDVILDAVASVSHVAQQDIEPSSHVVALNNVWREDVVTPSLPQDSVLAMAPASQEGRFRVPKILGE